MHWHPQKSLVISGSKDNQQPVKLWDPKTGQSLATLHAHKSTVMDVKWNENGNWLVTASRDHLLKLFDIRNLSQEVQTFRGHKKEASSVAWHPSHEGLFCSGGSDGAILFWHVGYVLSFPRAYHHIRRLVLDVLQKSWGSFQGFWAYLKMIQDVLCLT